MKNYIITLLLLVLALTGFSQEIGYEVFANYKRSIVKEKLNVAKTLTDINPGYASSWISHYYSVEILTTCDGVDRKALSENDKLSKEQISLLKKADVGTDIVVDIKYSPNISVKDDEVRTINFAFTVIPEIEAEYPGGYHLLKVYLMENAIEKLPEAAAKELLMAKVVFTVTEEGAITNAKITESSKDNKIDKLLLETVNKMPKWKPAENSNGLKLKQEFVLSVGNMVGC